MPKVRDILINVAVEVAQRKRKCHRKPDAHTILGGQHCLVIKDPTDGSKKNYCCGCAQEILGTAQTKLSGLRTQLQL